MPQLNVTNPGLAQIICTDINRLLLDHKITNIVLNHNDLQLINNDIIYFDPCPFQAYLSAKHITKLVNIYAYKKTNRAIDMIRGNELYLTNLILNEANDISEYSELFLRCGYLYQFIPSDYCSNRTCNGTICSNKKWFKNQTGLLPIDGSRKNIFIYCFTHTFNQSRHWDEYANQGTGVCVEYEIDIHRPEIINYGRIHYDNGYDFDFIKDIHNFIRINHNLSFLPIGISRSAMLYKRNKYKWEDESRIVFNINPSSSSFGINIPDIIRQDPTNFNMEDLGNNKQVLKIKNNNPLFKWVIKRVIAGHNISATDKSQLISTCASNNILLQ